MKKSRKILSPERNAAAHDFSQKLISLMNERGWSQSDTARQAALHMPDGHFGRDSINTYVQAKALPNPNRLNALAKAFGVSPTELVPDVAYPSLGVNLVKMEVRDAGDGNAHLYVSKQVPWPVALEILKMLDKS